MLEGKCGTCAHWQSDSGHYGWCKRITMVSSETANLEVDPPTCIAHLNTPANFGCTEYKEKSDAVPNGGS